MESNINCDKVNFVAFYDKQTAGATVELFLPGSTRTPKSRPMKHKPLAVRPMKHKPLAVRPMKRKPLAVCPMKHKPLAVRPMKHKPLAVRPMKHKPSAVHLNHSDYLWGSLLVSCIEIRQGPRSMKDFGHKSKV